jgi:hypothetical protein
MQTTRDNSKSNVNSKGPFMDGNAIIIDSESRPFAITFMKKVYSSGPAGEERLKNMIEFSKDSGVISHLGNDAQRIAKLGSKTQMSCGLAMMLFEEIKAGNKRDVGMLIKFLESIAEGTVKDFVTDAARKIMLMDKFGYDEREAVTKLLMKAVENVEDETGAAYAFGLAIRYFDLNLAFSAERFAEKGRKEGRLKQISKCSSDLDYW